MGKKKEQLEINGRESHFSLSKKIGLALLKNPRLFWWVISRVKMVLWKLKVEGLSNIRETLEQLFEERSLQFPKNYADQTLELKDDQRTVLMSDRFPEWDRDAGSRITWMYLQLLSELGFNVILLPEAQCREESYLIGLEKIGIRVLNIPSWLEGIVIEWLRHNARHLDYVFLNRPTRLNLKIVEFLRKYSNVKIYYHVHDLHHLRLMRQYRVTRQRAILKIAQEYEKREFYLIEHSDLVYTLSEHEKRLIKSKYPTKKVKLLIPTYYNELFLKKALPYESRDGLLFVGNFGFPPNEDAVLWFCKDIFPIVLRKVPDVKLYVVGSGVTDRMRQFASEKVCFLGFLPEDDLVKLYQRVKLSVVPLRYGAGVKGKLIEALLYGVPTVTTSIGAEGICGIDKVVFIEDEPRKFALRVTDVIIDKNLWCNHQSRCLSYVRRNYPKKRVLELLAEDFQIASNG